MILISLSSVRDYLIKLTGLHPVSNSNVCKSNSLGTVKNNLKSEEVNLNVTPQKRADCCKSKLKNKWKE